ncbi:helix-turn-helix domain-containing protein [Pantoea piersonii]|jgi:transcriptional regulator with XRE-family HTH domain|uniref:helix-turn-helix domain-containing protein n=1 Tax=Pantoea piersonii TaxID=2364647 RepID=UPI000EA10570|nr:helix-turn-helix transcriptional regulator [Pantoea piersonii]MBZ6388697.1 helix-turn-helix domain-containing protein [Pantoea piersonii]MBZ6402481.1 helix-turn-helix domain-containing protein [Pantoea piersonii]MBZ6410666.1 helix-turn-helix domain-containing protein [Pantoea piersonii]MBZ6429312.1 helix-turn-helix domain-containing protein [Pantoea piersonii]NYB04630.1 helix-turn-helix domain-containing protein [Pantoea piersonii]
MTSKVNITTDAEAGRVNQAVSAHLKLYRRQHKMSLDELSRRSGVSKGMLVEIEACRANPSIALLCRLASAMGVSVADFVNVAGKPAVHLIDAGDIHVLWKGEKGGNARLLAGTSGPDMIELWKWVLYPGEAFESPGHPEGTCELLHVSDGTLTLVVSDTTYTISSGGAAVAETDAPHAYMNTGTDVTVFTMTVHEKGR